MSTYRAEAEILEYAEDFASHSGVYFFPEQLQKEAFDLAIRFGKITLAINGTEANEGLIHAVEPEQQTALGHIGDAALNIGALLMRRVPRSSWRQLERSHLRELRWAEVVLPPAQSQILRLLSEGLRPSEIAREISKTLTTVNSNLGLAYKKLGIHSSIAAVARAYELGLFKTGQEQTEPIPQFTLTSRQKQIIALAMADEPVSKIGEQIGVKPRSVAREFSKILEATGAPTKAAVVRVILEAGGLENISEPESEDRNRPFLAGDYEQPEARYGMYAYWLSEIFLAFPNMPFTVEDIAKIIYAEQYSPATKNEIIHRTNPLLRAALKPAGTKGSLRTVYSRLAENNIRLSKVKLPQAGRKPSVRFIAHYIDNTISSGDIDRYLGLSDEELRNLAIKLRQEEIEHQWQGDKATAARKVNGGLAKTAEDYAVETEREAGFAKFTPREAAILKLLPDGLTNAQLAQVFGVSKNTIMTQVKNIHAKTKSQTRIQSALFAYRYLRDEINMPVVKEAALLELTTAQRQLLLGLKDGHSDPELAALLNKKKSTVRTQLKQLVGLTGLNRTQLAIIANEVQKSGLFDANPYKLKNRIKGEVNKSRADYEAERRKYHEAHRKATEKALTESHDLSVNDNRLIQRQAEQEIREWRAEEDIYLRQEEREMRLRSSKPRKQIVEPKQSVKTEPATVKVESALAGDDFPPGFIERIEKLEEELRHPPPHDEIVRYLREVGFLG